MSLALDKESKKFKPFSENDATYVAVLVMGPIFAVTGALIFGVIASFISIHVNNGDYFTAIKFGLLVFLGVNLVSLFIFWRLIPVFRDRKHKKKVIDRTYVLKVKKVGLFDADADSGVSLVLGSVFYFWIPDGNKRRGKRRFKVNMRAFKMLSQLNPEDEIEVSYLPISGLILSFKVPGRISWTPYIRGQGKFK